MQETSRRAFLSIGALVPFAALAQSPGAPVVGILWHAADAEQERPFRTPLLEGFANLGYASGKNIKFEERYADEKPPRFAELAVELARLKPNIIIAVSPLAASSVHRATSAIPVVFVGVPDPVQAQLVDSLARPGGNMTGVASLAENIWGKRIAVFRQALPQITKAALLAPGPQFRAASPLRMGSVLDEIHSAAQSFGVSLTTFDADSAEELQPAFKEIAQGGFEAVIVGPSLMFYAEKKRIADLALAHRMATVAVVDLFVEDGMLLSYGPSWPPMFRRVAWYVDRILKGANPAELPVEQPTAFETVVNLNTAKALGLELPPAFLNLADRVIE